jgi:hypothetical protein
MKLQIIITIVALLLCTAVLLAAISTGNDLNKHQLTFTATKAGNLLEGYWSSSQVDLAYYNVTPTGIHYYFSVDADSYETAYIDVPLWKHNDVTFKYNCLFTSDVGTLYAETELWSLDAAGNLLLMGSLSDSDAVWDHSANVNNGRVNLSADTTGVYSERMRIKVTGGEDTNENPDSAQVIIILDMPFNADYMETEYYKQMEGLK